MNPVTAAHLHLLLSHVPVMAIIFGLAGLAFGWWRSSREIQKAALAMFVVAALLAAPSYLTGEPATGAVKGLPGFSDHLVEQHQAAAGVALAGCIVLGVVALAGLILSRGRAVATWLGIVLLTGALLVGILVARTSNLGGQIRHPEIRPYDTPTE